MAKKPYPFSVCEQCCNGSGGGSSGGGMTESEIEKILVEYLAEHIIETKGIKVGTNDYNAIEGYDWNSFGIKSSPKTLGEILNGKLTETQLSEILADGIDFLTVKQLLTAYALHIDGDLSHIVVRDDKGNPQSLKDVFATLATKKEVGEISAVLDELHTYAQSLIGGGESE